MDNIMITLASIFAEEPEPLVAFGSGLKMREILPLCVPRSRLGRGSGLTPCGLPSVGPPSYNVDKTTSMFYNMVMHPDSRKGYTLGARTGAMHTALTSKMTVPCPSDYQRNILNTKKPKPCKKPFDKGMARFPTRKKERLEGTPGPGTYDHRAGQHRQVLLPQSFGETPAALPFITQRSTIPRNTVKLASTKMEQKYLRKLEYLKLYYD